MSGGDGALAGAYMVEPERAPASIPSVGRLENFLNNLQISGVLLEEEDMIDNSEEAELPTFGEEAEEELHL